VFICLKCVADFTFLILKFKCIEGKVDSKFSIVFILCHQDPSRESSINILSRVGCIMRQVTSRRIEYSEFIPHSLLHSHNLQSYNYCHRQYHNYLSCSHCHSPNTAQLVAAGLHWTRRLLEWNSLRRMQHSVSLLFCRLFIPLPIACCLLPVV
jgi:hypothetical protein